MVDRCLSGHLSTISMLIKGTFMGYTPYKGFTTNAVHAGQQKDPSTNALITPIYANSAFAHETPGVVKNYNYGRFHNPTRTAFENVLAHLESGSRAFAFASGMAAATTVLNLLPHGSHIIVSDDLYGGTYNLLEKILKVTSALEVTYADLTNVENFTPNIKENTRMVWVETPSNPLLKLTNLADIAGIARKKNIFSIADNTFASPFIQRPLERGFDISLHSTTKYINGHSDIIGGAVIVGDNTELQERMEYLQINLGAVPGPFDVFLAHRGLKTLALRMARHSENAMVVADFLKQHPKINTVIYPGLPSHPQYALAKTQMDAFGGMVTVILNGDVKDTERFLNRVELFTLAVSLGGVESLIQHPAIMTHSSIPKQQRESIGIVDGLVRISVGIEDADDLIHDLNNALKA